jgi:hypothetical protein
MMVIGLPTRLQIPLLQDAENKYMTGFEVLSRFVTVLKKYP